MNLIYGFVTVCKNILLSIAMFATERVEETEETLQIPLDLDLDEFSLTTNKPLKR